MGKISTTLFISVSLLFAACEDSKREYDATGTFETTETTVYAEQNGVLVFFAVRDGDNVVDGSEVGLIDTTQVWLKLRQLQATKEVYQSQKPDMQRQIAATRQQLAKARQEEQRSRELVADGAAPSKMLDDAVSQVKVLQRQLDAHVSTLSSTTRTLEKQMAATDVQISQLRDQLHKCHIIAPTSGSGLEKYVEQGEVVTTGKPLFMIADIANMYLRAYVTSTQLQNVRVGQQVSVFADYGGGQRKEYKGIVSWISSRSEFTPKNVLTDDERADQVYAVKILVKNDGYVKIGMYGGVKF